jgi:hypothetical protein
VQFIWIQTKTSPSEQPVWRRSSAISSPEPRCTASTGLLTGSRAHAAGTLRHIADTNICRIVCMETMISIIHKCCKNMPLEEDNQRVGSAIYFPELRSVRYVSVDQGLARGSIEAPRLCCERTSRSGEKAVSGNKERSQISLK